MSSSMRERELKFSPGPSFRMHDLVEGLNDLEAGAPTEQTLHATYYDTIDLRLARSGASLRWRDDHGWVVKLPVARADVLTRNEIGVAGEPGTIPQGALDLVYALVRSEPVAPVAKLVSVRHRVHLRDAEGRVVAEAVDDEVSVLDGAHLTARFRELEVEFTDDAPDRLADEVVTVLRAAGAGSPDPVPKIV